MSTVTFRGDAPAVKQVKTVQITAYDAATTYKLTINGKTVSVPGDTDEATTASNLADAWNASTIPEFAEVTASVATDTVTLTSDTAGKDFDATSSVSGGTGTIGAVTETTANSGPEDAASVQNYSSGALPSASDDFVIENLSTNLRYGLDALASIALNIVYVDRSFTGQAGLPVDNTDGTKYREYRQSFFQIQTDLIYIGNGPGNGSSLLQLEVIPITSADIYVYDTGPQTGDANYPLLILTNDATGHLYIYSGSVEMSPYDADTVNLGTVIVNGGNFRMTHGRVNVAITVNGGSADLYQTGNLTTATVNDGQLTITAGGSCTIGTLDINGGQTVIKGGLTITDANINGFLDLSQDDRTITFTNPPTIGPDADILDPYGFISSIALSGTPRRLTCADN